MIWTIAMLFDLLTISFTEPRYVWYVPEALRYRWIMDPFQTRKYSHPNIIQILQLKQRKVRT